MVPSLLDFNRTLSLFYSFFSSSILQLDQHTTNSILPLFSSMVLMRYNECTGCLSCFFLGLQCVCREMQDGRKIERAEDTLIVSKSNTSLN